MNSNESLYSLLQNTQFSQNILCGLFFPDNNNMAFTDISSVATVTVLENLQKNSPTIVAFGAIHACANNQAYLMVCKCVSKYKEKSVIVEKFQCDDYSSKMDKSRQQYYTISSVLDKDFDYSGLPDYFGAFEDRLQQHLLVHVYDQLVNAALKTSNMDLIKNVTVDLYDTEFTEKTRQLYRDQMGLLVADKTRYFEIVMKKSDLQEITANRRTRDANVSYSVLNAKNQYHFYDYESVITFMNRRSYLEFLYSINGISGVVAIESQQPLGYALALNNQIVQCYADSPEIACDLIYELIDKMPEQLPIKMFVRECSNWICNELLDKAVRIERIHRFHSRILPVRVKWENVFLMNIGAHVF